MTQRLKRLAGCESGVSMLEFGLLLPILVLILIGSIEVTRMVLIYQKVDNATSRVADMITRTDSDVVPCTGVGSTSWMRTRVLVESMRPFQVTADTSLIISAVEATYPNPAIPNDDNVLDQTVTWQWRSGNDASAFGTRGSNVRSDDDWPEPFRQSPNAGGMYERDRVIATEVWYVYRPLLDSTAVILPFLGERTIYRQAFYRGRFGKLTTLGCAG